MMMFNIQDKAGCEGWTWLSETNADYPNYCLMLSSLGDIENYPNCVREGEINLFIYHKILILTMVVVVVCSKTSLL